MMIIFFFRVSSSSSPTCHHPALDHLSALGKGALSCFASVERNYCTGSKEQPAPGWRWFPASGVPLGSLQSKRKMPGGLNVSSDSLELRVAGIIVPIIFSLIFLVGIVGNGLVLAVLLWNGQVKYSTTNLFILNLAVADLCFIICCVPFQATIYTLDGWLFGAFACKAVHLLIYLTMYASSFTLAAVSVDRYLAIRYPLKSRDLRTSQNAGVAIVVIWSLSLLFAGPYLSYYQIIHYHGVPICVPIWEDQRRKVLDILTFVFGYLLPVTVVSLAYIRTIRFLWTSVDPIERISESRKAKRKVTKMIVTVAILFCLCWLPHHLVILCFWFGHFPFNRATYAFRLASHCLSYANSCLNPIVYSLISKHFRKHFKQVFTCIFFQNKIRKKKKRIGRKVHMVNVERGFTNRMGAFYGDNIEVTHVPENTRNRDLEGASHARAWTRQVQDAMVSVQKERMEGESLATAGHSLGMIPLRGTVGQDQEEALEKG
ncbi:galanin receptor type 3 isoform X1 [Malurus melanocephalus]|uniref:galanin receptor type 3 isoform X1 n=2 Tax=Malurus melanocephalus TaxID=175006 RepID=UPI002549BC0B|nr:galanin receptor type 3 isoform X1 [Malurus melanocephalus]